MMTYRQARVGLAFLASSGNFITVASISRGLNVPIPDIVPTVAALAHLLRSERIQQAFIEHRHGYGYVLFGTGPRLMAFEEECRAVIDAVANAEREDAAAGARMRKIGVAATPSSMMGAGG